MIIFRNFAEQRQLAILVGVNLRLCVPALLGCFLLPTGLGAQAFKPNTATPALVQAERTSPSSVLPAPDLPEFPDPFLQTAIPSLIASPLALPPPMPANSGPIGIQSTAEVIKVFLGLVFLSALAYLVGTARALAIERKLGVTEVIAAGLPFVLLGVIAHSHGVGILSESVLWQLRPLLALGLGWIGFTTGFRFDSKLGDSIRPGISTISMITAAIPFATVVLTCGLLLAYTERSANTGTILRDAIMLGTAGAMTAYSAPRFFHSRRSPGLYLDHVATITTLEQLAGLVGLLVVAAYFRPQDTSVAWHLPGTAWLFITIGMGTMLGGVVWGMLARVKMGPEFTVLILGSICFAAGMASFLRISPLVVCFIVGLILVNLPGTSKDQIRETLEYMERPILLLFLLIAGSLWDVTHWQGWALMLLFVPARLLGKWIAVRVSEREFPQSLTADEQRSLIFSPMGTLSIAIVVNAQDLYYGSIISWMVTAVIGGSILTEIILQVTTRGSRRDEKPVLSAAV